MIGPKRTVHRANADYIRREKLVAKLLTRVITELKRQSNVPLTNAVADEARKILEQRWTEAGDCFTEADLRRVCQEVRSNLNLGTRTQSVNDVRQNENQDFRALTPQTEAPLSVSQARDLKEMLHNTTRRQRQMMADAEWIQAADLDRRAAVEGKAHDRIEHKNHIETQKAILDAQLQEHLLQQEQDRQNKLRTLRESTMQIEEHRRLLQKEKQEQHEKAERERRIRENQQRENEELRQRQRQEELDAQLRQQLVVQEELRKQREKEAERKRKEKEEWSKVLQDNQEKLREKERQKERAREEDLRYQRIYAESVEKQERERAEALRRKEERAKYFGSLAQGVAQLFLAKEQDQTAKIDAVYQEQLRRSLEDENNRKVAQKNRQKDCLRVQTEQIAERKRLDELAKEEERRLAEELRQQAEEAARVEEVKKRAAKEEARRVEGFLSTQLQMAHFKETRPVETSIARPPSVAASMFTPSKLTPTPKLQ